MMDILSSVPLFQGLPEDHLRDLSGIILERTFLRGETIFHDGDEGDGFYVVVSGRVKIFKVSPEGKEQILHLFGPGEPFGEVPVFAGQRFPASAQVLEDSRLFFFPRKGIMALISEDPSLALNMLAILSERLRGFTRLIDDLALKDVAGRLAAYLLFTSDEEQGTSELRLTTTKGQLASLLGTVPETLSRVLAKLSARGLIQTDGPLIRILDREGLEHLVLAGKNGLG